MIVKVICDRCGKEVNDLDKERVLFAAVSKKAAMIHIPKIDGDENCYIDLCPKCAKSFHEWMHSANEEAVIDLNSDLNAELAIPEN